MESTIGILNLPQREFNRQIFELIRELKEENEALTERVEALENA